MQAQRENEHCKGSAVLTNVDTAKGKLNKQRKQKCEGNNNDTESDSDLRREETKRGVPNKLFNPLQKRRGISVVVTADSHAREESIEKKAINELLTWSFLMVLNKIPTKRVGQMTRWLLQ